MEPPFETTQPDPIYDYMVNEELGIHYCTECGHWYDAEDDGEAIDAITELAANEDPRFAHMTEDDIDRAVQAVTKRVPFHEYSGCTRAGVEKMWNTPDW